MLKFMLSLILFGSYTFIFWLNETDERSLSQSLALIIKSIAKVFLGLVIISYILQILLVL